MQLEHSFTVPVPVDDAWRVLLDIEQIAPCMPGAVLDSIDGDDFTGRVKVKLGPISLTYKGKASFVKKDEATHTAVIDAAGKDQRGNGTAAATVTATLKSEGASTRVDVLTDLNITGKPAQFGRGVMVDVGNKLIGQFASCVEGKLGATGQAGDSSGGDSAAPAAATGQAGDSSGGERVASAAATGQADAGATGGQGAAGAGGRAADKAAAEAARGRDTAEAEEPARASSAADAAASSSPSPGGAASSLSPGGAGGSSPSPGGAGGSSASPRGAGSSPTAGSAGSSSSAGAGTTASRPRAVPSREPEPIDLLDLAGGSVLTRFGVPAAGLAGAVLILAYIIRKVRS